MSSDFKNHLVSTLKYIIPTIIYVFVISFIFAFISNQYIRIGTVIITMPLWSYPYAKFIKWLEEKKQKKALLKQLQTIVESHGKSIINDQGKYKTLTELLNILNDIWDEVSDDDKLKVSEIVFRVNIDK